MQNLNTTSTFKDYIDSIAAEITRLLAVLIEVDEPKYTVEIKDTDWSKEQDGSMSGLAILFSDDCGTNTYFSIAEFEFEDNKEKPQFLRRIAETRFIDAVYCLRDKRDDYSLMVRKLER